MAKRIGGIVDRGDGCWQGGRAHAFGLAEPGDLGDGGIMQAVTDRLRNFLQFVAVKLIDDPAQAQLKVAELGPKRLRFKLVLAREDVAMLIGRNGFTASAIRSVLKAAADKEGVQVNLQIHSHEEEAEFLAREA
jgi:predicted RNA-binding protein YlqC (UPF0109 family)